jgi:hypothetical protein
MQAKMDKLLPPPPDPSPPALGGPAGSVMIGTVRVGMLRLSIPLGGKGARDDLLDNMGQQPKSSVPDPNTCD